MSNSIVRTVSTLSIGSAALAASAQNLVVNGDFSQGFAGWSSGLTYAAPATDALRPEGVYTLVTNTRSPYVLNTVGIANYNEHTTGTGLAMFINGATDGDGIAWHETLSGLTVGQTYRFGAWFSRWTPNAGAAAILSLAVDGVTLSTFNDPSTPGIWAQQSALFVATSTSMTMQVVNSQRADVGNDFGLDDITVVATPEPSAFAALGLGVFAVLRRRKRA